MKACAAALAALLLYLTMTSPASAQTPDATAETMPGTALQISLLTFGPGAVYWERFGHNAILVRDTRGGSAIAYNYGIFDFNQKNFFLNFARGYMNYRMAADPLDYDLAMYSQEGRSVTEQPLDLTPAQRERLDQFLRWNARPENAQYRYDYFVSNCSTRVRDALDRVLNGALKRQLRTQPAPTGHTYRFDAVRLISPDPWLGLAMDIALGPSADRPLNLWQESFAPAVFSQAVRSIQLEDADGGKRPLVAPAITLLPPRLPSAPSRPPHLLRILLAVGLILAVLLLALSRSNAWPARLGFTLLAGALSLLCGVGGLILAALWGLTQHWGGWYNENLLLLNPLALLLIPGWIAWLRARPIPRHAPRLAFIIAALAAASLLLRLLPGCYQANLHWIALFLPIHIALALSLNSFSRKT